MQHTARSGMAYPSCFLGCLLHRSVALILTVFASSLLMHAVFAGENPSKPSVPNIVLILTDDK